MIINIGWREIQKKYIMDKGVKRNNKSIIQKFMTESTLIFVDNIYEERNVFVFLYNSKEFNVTLVGDKTCELGSELFFDFGIKIAGEIVPYLREYKKKYINMVAM